MWTYSVILCLTVISGSVYTWMNEAECLTSDGSAGHCLATSECPPSHYKGKPILCRYSRGYGMRICCPRHSFNSPFTYPFVKEKEDFYSNDQPISFPSEDEEYNMYNRPSTNSYNKPYSNENSNYRPNHPSTNYFDRPSHKKRPDYDRPTHNERPSFLERPDYNDRPSFNNQPNFNERPHSSSNTPSFSRPDYNERPSFSNSRPNYNERPEMSYNEHSFSRPQYNERPNFSSNRPNYNEGPSGPSRPDYHERPVRPDFNERPSSGSSRPDYQERPVRPDFNERPGSGSSRPDFNVRPIYNSPNHNERPSNGRPIKPGQDVWSSPEDSSEEYPTNRRTTSRPTWSVEGDKETFSSGKKRISEFKCEEYIRTVSETINPLPLSIDSEAVPLTVQKCDFSAVKLIVGGEASELGEFPHMAAVGFRSSSSHDISWNCGGTLISERFVMTAAHCANTTYGNPSVVRLGEYNLARDNDGAEPEDYRVDKIIIHPNYEKSRKYNDIALLRLSRQVIFNKSIRPACLSADNTIRSTPTATGWGRTDFVGRQSDILMKVYLNIIDNQQCNSFYNKSPGSSSFSSGITDTMICAGVLQGGRDTCLGDSGGPLTITKKDNPCVHYAIGITSFGKICGAPYSPGVYTKVSKYVPWIERTIWPNTND